MQPAYQFTDDDRFYPIYCTQCKAHIPKAVSNSGGGICPPCHQVATTLVAQQQANIQQRAQMVAHARFHTNTGRGKCPQCQALNINQFQVQQSNNTGGILIVGFAFLGTGLFCCLPVSAVGAIMIIVGIIMACVGPRTVSTSRECGNCGFRWTV